MKRILFILQTFPTLLLFLPSPAVAEELPNIVLIIADDASRNFGQPL